jgi:DNA invertase Pin-like site-specific DNA recombinase
MTNQQQSANQPQLPAAGNVAIYARAATQEKRNKESRQVQKDDLITYAHQLGYEETNMIVFEQDNGIPATTAIDEREGLRSLVQAIEGGTIQAVLIADETRLFRDVSAMQLNNLIRLCVEHNTQVITPELTYDFTNPHFVKLFRFKCEQAFQVLEEIQKIMQRTRSK